MRAPAPRVGRFFVGTLIALAAALTGCGGGDQPPSGPSGAASSGPIEIEIRDFKFVPQNLEVAVGQQITVINRDRAPHTLTASSGAFDSGELGQEQSFSFRAPAAGTYPYICDLHQYMTGTLTVAAPG